MSTETMDRISWDISCQYYPLSLTGRSESHTVGPILCLLLCGIFSGLSNCHHVPSCPTNMPHIDKSLCSLRLSSWDVGSPLLCAAWIGVQYWHSTIMHHYQWMRIIFWFCIAYQPDIFAFHLTSAFVWTDSRHCGLKCNKCARKLINCLQNFIYVSWI